MRKLFGFIKNNFLKKSFIIFCIIGVINTLINAVVMKGSIFGFEKIYSGIDISTKDAGFPYYLSMAISTLLAFVIASIASYFLNAKFTYKEKTDSKTFLEASIAYVSRYILTYGFTLLIWWLIIVIFKVDNDPNGWYRTLANLIASVIMIPPFYLVLGFIFKRTKLRKVKKEEN